MLASIHRIASAVLMSLCLPVPAVLLLTLLGLGSAETAGNVFVFYLLEAPTIGALLLITFFAWATSDILDR